MRGGLAPTSFHLTGDLIVRGITRSATRFPQDGFEWLVLTSCLQLENEQLK